ncbi:MAG: HD domain-containing phosphohydrolase [Planctomycetota bacterium]
MTSNPDQIPAATRLWLAENFRQQDPERGVLKTVSDLLQTVVGEKRLDHELLEQILLPVLSDLTENPLSQLCWYTPSGGLDYRSLHALNAMRMAMFYGLAHEKSEAGVVRLGVTGLLYDIGMWLPEANSLLTDKAGVDNQMMAVMLKLPTRAAELLTELNDVDDALLRVSLEHHERADGSGYPDSLPRNQLHDASLLFQMIDSFLGQVEHRHFRPLRSSVDARARLVTQQKRGHYDQAVFKKFLVAFGLFPIGSIVRLRSGALALVTGVQKDDLKRPPVRLLTDEAGHQRKQMVEMRLKDHPAEAITDGL